MKASGERTQPGAIILLSSVHHVKSLIQWRCAKLSLSSANVSVFLFGVLLALGLAELQLQRNERTSTH